MQIVFPKSIIHDFENDANLLFPSKKLGTIEFVMNHELKLLVQWLWSNELSLNEAKTSTWPWIRNKVKLRQFAKYIGFFIGEILPWNKQIDNICSKLVRASKLFLNYVNFYWQNVAYLFITLSFIQIYPVDWSGLTQSKAMLTVLANYKNVALEFFLSPTSVAMLMVYFSNLNC